MLLPRPVGRPTPSWTQDGHVSPHILLWTVLRTEAARTVRCLPHGRLRSISRLRLNRTRAAKSAIHATRILVSAVSGPASRSVPDCPVGTADRSAIRVTLASSILLPSEGSTLAAEAGPKARTFTTRAKSAQSRSAVQPSTETASTAKLRLPRQQASGKNQASHQSGQRNDAQSTAGQPARATRIGPSAHRESSYSKVSFLPGPISESGNATNLQVRIFLHLRGNLQPLYKLLIAGLDARVSTVSLIQCVHCLEHLRIFIQ